MARRETAREPLKTLTDLEQIRIIADPLRLRMLEAFGEERTTKQVADLLKEKPTRLYHHVDALEGAGLIRLTRTARKRGTTEKYYQAVAESFRAELGLFTPAGAETDPLFDLIDHTLDRTRLELREMLGTGGAAVLEEEGLHTFVEIEATPDRIDRLRTELMSLLDGLREDESPAGSSDEDAAADESTDDQQRYRLTIALFPLAGEAKD